jgi:hypothetical protein
MIGSGQVVGRAEVSGLGDGMNDRAIHVPITPPPPSRLVGTSFADVGNG